MNTYTPYRNRGFMDPDEPMPSSVEFNTTDDLLALEDVKPHKAPGAEFVISDGYLMVLTHEGFEWWVLGRISNPSVVNLPKWRGAKCRVAFADGHEEIAEDGRVVSICGDVITLRDGTTCTRMKPKGT